MGYDSSPRLARLAHVGTSAIRHHPLFLNSFWPFEAFVAIISLAPQLARGSPVAWRFLVEIRP